jgi:hypothetical protein
LAFGVGAVVLAQPVVEPAEDTTAEWFECDRWIFSRLMM